MGRGRRWGQQPYMPPYQQPYRQTVPGVVKVAAPVDVPQGINSPISYVFARAPYFALVDVRGGKVVNVQVLPNQYAMGGGGVGIAVAQWLLSMGVTVVVGPPLGPKASALLQQAGVRMVPAQPGTPLGEALKTAGIA